MRGYCKVIIWLTYNIVVSQGIGGPRRGREMRELVSGVARTHTFIKLTVLYVCGLWRPPTNTIATS